MPGALRNNSVVGLKPVTNAVPTITMRDPAIMPKVMTSPRKRLPHKIPKTGIRNVTVSAEVAPMSRISRK